MYEEWCKAFDPEQHKREISELLVNVPEVRALYARLVCTTSGASKVYHMQFTSFSNDRQSHGLCAKRSTVHIVYLGTVHFLRGRGGLVGFGGSPKKRRP